MMNDDRDIVRSILFALPKAELVERIIRMRAELEELHIKLGAAKATLADNQATCAISCASCDH